MDTKTACRKRLKHAIASLGSARKAALSRCIRRVLALLISSYRPKRIFAFAPTDAEPDVWPLYKSLLADGIKLLFPAVRGRRIIFRAVSSLSELTPGTFGIREPRRGGAVASAGRADIVLVPCLGIDSAGRRIGRGGGFYDRWLSKNPSCRRMGVVFYCQILNQVAHESHDADIKWAVCEKGLVLFVPDRPNPDKSISQGQAPSIPSI